MAEKEYLLGNKAKDLLIHTFTVTRPISDDKLAASDVLAALKNIQSGGDQQQVSQMLNDSIERLSKKRKKQGFPKSVTHTYVKELREAAVRILKNVHAANECMFDTEHELRLSLIKEVLDDCNLMLKLLEVSMELGYIDIRRMKHWSELVLNVKYMSASWKKKDGERARKLQREKDAKTLEAQKEMVQQAVREALAQR